MAWTAWAIALARNRAPDVTPKAVLRPTLGDATYEWWAFHTKERVELVGNRSPSHAPSPSWPLLKAERRALKFP